MSYQSRLKDFVARLSSTPGDYDRFAYWYYRRYDHNEMRRSDITRTQDCFTTAFIVVDPGFIADEMIVGRPFRPLNEEERATLDNLVAVHGKDVLKLQGSTAGLTIDVPLLLNKGLEWIIGEMDKKSAGMPDGADKDAYLAGREGFSSVIRYSHKVSQYLGGISIKETDPTQKKLLHTLAKITWRVPQFSCKTFHEAVQALHFVTFALTVIPGQVKDVVLKGTDQALAPFLNADLESGKLDIDTAKYIVGCFFAQANFSAYHDYGLTIELTGDDNNPVTQIFKEVKAVLDMPQPTLK